MKRLELEDVRTALYEMNVPEVHNFAGDALRSADFWFDLGMDEREIAYLISNLEIEKKVKIPVYVWDSLREKNTVNVLIHGANGHLIDLEEN